MTIELKDLQFPINKTIFEILGKETDQTTIKAWMDKEVEGWRTRFKSIGNPTMIKPVLIIGAKYEDYLKYYNTYSLENDYIKPANKDALNEIALIFKADSADSELIKLLKEIANSSDQQELLKASFEDEQGGVAWVVFVLDTFKNFYLDKLPNYVNEKLNIAEAVKLEEVKGKIKPILTDIFSNCYSSFVKVEKETDLEPLKNGVNDDLKQIEEIINEVRKTKKPKEEPKPSDYDKIKADLKKWTDAFPKSDPDFNKEPKGIEEDYKRYKIASQKPSTPAEEEHNLGIDDDKPENVAKKKLIVEIRRVAKLKNISVHFTNDKTKLVSASKTDIYLLLDQKDTGGQFNANLVLHDFAQELTGAELNNKEKNPSFWKQLIKEQAWLKDSLGADYQQEYNKIINPSIFPADKLNITELLRVNYLENKDNTSSNMVISSNIVDKAWQTVRDKVLDLVGQEVEKNQADIKDKLAFKLEIGYNNPDYTIMLNYNPNAPFSRDLDKLMTTTPLLLEIERLKQERGKLPNPENFEKISKQNQLWEENFHDLTDKKNYTRVKEKIDKI
jgi:hypothetical protein